jgi:hypothetical protein
MWQEGLGQLKKCNDLIGNRARLQTSGLQHSASTNYATVWPLGVVQGRPRGISGDYFAKYTHDKGHRSRVDQLQQVIILSNYQNCPAHTTSSPRTAPRWNKKLSGLKVKTKKLFNTAKRTGQLITYKETLTGYNKEIRKAN